MTVLVTRAQPDAARWVDELRAHGLPAQALPLIAVQAVGDQAPLRRAIQSLCQCTAVMFVSAHAAQGFFAAAPPGTAGVFGDAGSPPAPQAWCTGPGTARALRACGVAQAAIVQPPADAPQFDSEALWALVQEQMQPGSRLLIVRGAEAGVPGEAPGAAGPGDRADESGNGGDGGDAGAGRDWLARQARSRGAQVDVVVSYRRGLPDLDAVAGDWIAQGASGQALWLFNSSQAIANLLALRPGTRWQQARALCTHPRIADTARAAGFGVVQVSRPGLNEVVASIESMQ